MSPKYCTEKYRKQKKIFVTEITHNKIRKSHQDHKITMYSTTDISGFGGLVVSVLASGTQD
jgi:hypothetical protein